VRKPLSENAIDYTVLAFPKGTVRLAGKELEALRRAMLKRDKSNCQACRVAVSDSFPAWHPKKAHMAHIKSRGAGGSDTLDNIRTLCGECHREEHSKGRNNRWRQLSSLLAR
jgi:5-methylcytosine-specific restriction endonuclease McrA